MSEHIRGKALGSPRKYQLSPRKSREILGKSKPNLTVRQINGQSMRKAVPLGNLSALLALVLLTT